MNAKKRRSKIRFHGYTTEEKRRVYQFMKQYKEYLTSRQWLSCELYLGEGRTMRECSDIIGVSQSCISHDIRAVSEKCMNLRDVNLPLIKRTWQEISAVLKMPGLPPEARSKLDAMRKELKKMVDIRII